MYQVIKKIIKLGHYSNGFYLLFLLMLYPHGISAQDFNTHWIYAPQADSCSHVWFRRAFISGGLPRQATVAVASTGVYKLYVNECNVGTALYYPLRHGNDSTAISISFDITPYLRQDTNVVAVIYSPTRPSISRRQISVNVYGTDHDGKPFSNVSDNSWICRRANSSMTPDRGEAIDGTCHNPAWKAATIYDEALWTGAETFKGSGSQQAVVYHENLHAMKAIRVTSYRNLHLSQDPIDVYPPFGFSGFPRITLREAKSGERIRIGNITYICNGNTDEQAFPVFTISGSSPISISGDPDFNPGQVNAIDLVETGEEYFPTF